MCIDSRQPGHQQHNQRIAHHAQHLEPSSLGHQHAGRQADQINEDTDGHHLPSHVQQSPVVLGKAGHCQEVQRNHQGGDQQKTATGGLEFPAVMGVKPDPENHRRDGHEDEKLEDRNLFQRVPKADHQRHRRAHDQQAGHHQNQLRPANVAFFQEGGQQFGPRLSRRLGRDRNRRLARRRCFQRCRRLGWSSRRTAWNGRLLSRLQRRRHRRGNCICFRRFIDQLGRDDLFVGRPFRRPRQRTG